MSTALSAVDDLPRESHGAMVDVAQTRAAQEVQAAMIVAKRFPRSESDAWARIMKACHRMGLAEQSQYSYPRGGSQVTGPSIRLAEVMAQNWGNLDFGIVELEQRKNAGRGESVVQAYCWDMETNTRQTKVFTVPHVRATREKTYPLTDPRDIYEMVANQGARRLRACILGIIPGDVVDAALKECDKTLAGNNSEPLSDRIRKMVAAFDEFNVSAQQIQDRYACPVDRLTEQQLVQLRKVYTSIKDGMVSATDAFPSKAPTAPEEPQRGVAAVARRVSRAKKTEQTTEPAARTVEDRKQEIWTVMRQTKPDITDEEVSEWYADLCSKIGLPETEFSEDDWQLLLTGAGIAF